jgi:hypothetical protein
MLHDLEILCWNSQHLNYNSLVAVPSLIIWGFGIPLFAWIILARNKNSLEEIEVRQKYGFLFNGYKK